MLRINAYLVESKKRKQENPFEYYSRVPQGLVLSAPPIVHQKTAG